MMRDIGGFSTERHGVFYYAFSLISGAKAELVCSVRWRLTAALRLPKSFVERESVKRTTRDRPEMHTLMHSLELPYWPRIGLRPRDASWRPRVGFFA